MGAKGQENQMAVALQEEVYLQLTIPLCVACVSGPLLERVMPDGVEPQETTGITLLSHLRSFYINSNKWSFSESVIPSQIKVTDEEFFLKGASNQAFVKKSSYKKSSSLIHTYTQTFFLLKKVSFPSQNKLQLANTHAFSDSSGLCRDVELCILFTVQHQTPRQSIYL